jgi:hypothetical protein
LSWYLDASVMIPILVKEPASAAVDAFMSSVQQEPWVSDFAAAEVASALSRLVRTGRLEASVGAASLSDFDVWRAAMTRPAEMYAADIRLPECLSADLISRCEYPTRCISRLFVGSVSRW